MKKTFLLLMTLAISTILFAQNKQAFVSTDIDNFWNSYEKIISTTDTLQQTKYLRDLYIEKGSKGLKSLIEVRNYSDKAFIDAIKSYPVFWRSIRTNTLNVKDHYGAIEEDIEKLRLAYSALKPATIYFSVGVFRTGGTTMQDQILIGSELSLADKSTKIDELPRWRQPFYKENPLKEGLALLCTHEYVHTQQKELIHNLLSMCLYEGVAEFISCQATGKKSDSPAIDFGKANQEKVLTQFIKDLFIISNNEHWMWGENRNGLKVRDLGYYIGYEICERYYHLSNDKSKAIKELIELDYTNEKELERIIDLTQFLPKTVQELNNDYEQQRPAIVSISPFKNGSKNVKPGMTKITVTFSEPLNGISTSVDFGPLGAEAFPKLKSERVWSPDGKTWTFDADLKPDQHYQILISNNFRKANGVRLKSYLIDFHTVE
jgi:hypothetical protein